MHEVPREWQENPRWVGNPIVSPGRPWTPMRKFHVRCVFLQILIEPRFLAGMLMALLVFRPVVWGGKG